MEHKRSDGNPRAARVLSGAALKRADVTNALTRSFFEEWARTGYAGLSLERVARTAGVGKAALYRRWPDKVSMASDLLSQVGLTVTDVEEHGSLEADLHAVLLAIRRILRHPKVRRILTDLHGGSRYWADDRIAPISNALPSSRAPRFAQARLRKLPSRSALRGRKLRALYPSPLFPRSTPRSCNSASTGQLVQPS